MNGKAAKRLRIAAERMVASSNGAISPAAAYKALKRDYRSKPYHQRPALAVTSGPRLPVLPHSETLIRAHEDRELASIL